MRLRMTSYVNRVKRYNVMMRLDDHFLLHFHFCVSHFSFIISVFLLLEQPNFPWMNEIWRLATERPGELVTEPSIPDTRTLF